jgi:hypothetical protein
MAWRSQQNLIKGHLKLDKPCAETPVCRRLSWAWKQRILSVGKSYTLPTNACVKKTTEECPRYECNHMAWGLWDFEHESWRWHKELALCLGCWQKAHG